MDGILSLLNRLAISKRTKRKIVNLMKNLPRGFFLLLILASTLSAQQPVITSGTQVDQNTLSQWLHSADPRLIAWAADFAHRNHNTPALDEATQGKVSDPVVVDLDGDQVFSRRHEENGGWGSCGEGVEELSPVTRHRLLAYWLGVPDRDMSWQPLDSFAILWRDKPAYQVKLGKIIESERLKLQATVDSLRQRDLLKPDEAAMPRLVVKIHCDIRPCPLH